MIMVIILAVLALIVVKALAQSPWGTFTVMATIPIALLMGVYLRYLRPGASGDVGHRLVLLLASIVATAARWRAIPVWGRCSPSTASSSPGC
jgi:carbon starvation protein CstA